MKKNAPPNRPLRQRNTWPIDAFAAFVAIFAMSKTAHAYIDPGTGSAILYVITGLVLSIYFGFKNLIFKVEELLYRKKTGFPVCNLAIHCEDPRYENTFFPIMNALPKDAGPVQFFTMYERDASFRPLPDGVQHFAIPPGLLGYSMLNRLEGKGLLSTTPQLDVMMFKRSKKMKHYCYVEHALGESRFVRPFAYDFYDTVLCCGPLLKNNIKTIEKIRGFNSKTLLETGIPHWDELLQAAAQNAPPNDAPVVLIAPSWGPSSLFEVFGLDFVEKVAAQFRVIVRPHPQMRISQAALYEQILGFENVHVDTEPTPASALQKADILVSDISGIVDEFVFIHEKPAIVVGHSVAVDAFEGHFLKDVRSLREIRSDVVMVLSPDDFGAVTTKIAQMLGKDFAKRIPALRNELVYNFGAAGPAAAHQIKEILQCL